MEFDEKEFIIPMLQAKDIKELLSLLNPDMKELSDFDIVYLALAFFTLVCDAHYDKGNKRKKVILNAMIENDADLFVSSLKTLLNQRMDLKDIPEFKRDFGQR